MKPFKINYAWTGISSLRIAGGILFFASLIYCFSTLSHANGDLINYGYSAVVAIAGFFVFSLCLVLSTIAENALYQKSKLESEIEHPVEKEY